jgi:hypothetical protein
LRDKVTLARNGLTTYSCETKLLYICAPPGITGICWYWAGNPWLPIPGWGGNLSFSYLSARQKRSFFPLSPKERPIEPREIGEVVAIPRLGGLHHRDSRELRRAA